MTLSKLQGLEEGPFTALCSGILGCLHLLMLDPRGWGELRGVVPWLQLLGELEARIRDVRCCWRNASRSETLKRAPSPFQPVLSSQGRNITGSQLPRESKERRLKSSPHHSVP